MTKMFFLTKRGKVVIVFFILLVAGSVAFFLEENVIRQIKLNLKTTPALVTEVKYFDRYHHHRVDYCFKAETNSKICGYDFCDEISIKRLSKLKNKQIVVAFDSLNPIKSRILLTEEDFESFNIPYPDSLSWVKDLLNE